MIRLSKHIFNDVHKSTVIIKKIMSHVSIPVNEEIKHVVLKHAIMENDIILLKYLHQEIGLNKCEMSRFNINVLI